MPIVADFDTALHREIGAFRYDPLGFVMFAFPWGIPHTPLAEESGPEEWQREVLVRIGNGLLDGHFSEAGSEAVRVAIASGHGIGKSALVCWLILGAMSTLRDTRGVVSANTEGQLRTKTWPELAKWHAMARNKAWFTYTATALHSAEPGRDKTWRVDAITWSEQDTEAIAGLHNKGRRAFCLLDEASSIPDPVWDTIEGALTDADTELVWAVFGNPTRTTGRFRECFFGGRFAHRWSPQQIDSRSVGMTNKVQIAAWGEGPWRGFGFHPRPRARPLPPHRLAAVHRRAEGRRRGGAAACRGSNAAAHRGGGFRRPGRRPDRLPRPRRPRCALDPGREVPHSRPHAGRQP